jgi:hypothetical protein
VEECDVYSEFARGDNCLHTGRPSTHRNRATTRRISACTIHIFVGCWHAETYGCWVGGHVVLAKNIVYINQTNTISTCHRALLQSQRHPSNNLIQPPPPHLPYCFPAIPSSLSIRVPLRCLNNNLASRGRRTYRSRKNHLITIYHSLIRDSSLVFVLDTGGLDLGLGFGVSASISASGSRSPHRPWSLALSVGLGPSPQSPEVALLVLFIKSTFSVSNRVRQ